MGGGRGGQARIAQGFQHEDPGQGLVRAGFRMSAKVQGLWVGVG